MLESEDSDEPHKSWRDRRNEEYERHSLGRELSWPVTQLLTTLTHFRQPN